MKFDTCALALLLSGPIVYRFLREIDGKIGRIITLTSSQLLKKFDFELCDPMNPWVSVNYGLWMQKDMFVRITLRSAE